MRIFRDIWERVDRACNRRDINSMMQEYSPRDVERVSIIKAARKISQVGLTDECVIDDVDLMRLSAFVNYALRAKPPRGRPKE